ncbi:hypothetical protein A3F00_00705 [Candidatus Daviesbacteria bacterium RIFCSPHIGHO2_12_FULL_37_11]|uniref:Beta-lactamase class A catalytic domain-containing protein n=1 Tax=Candidatus Daviesbacteria bacterium RIFCSPHIGHO2_12_FULL_37_11 TaxID=1797777 RepID=A0A1F5KBM7_9BACT|nr:MAG: hypothetical protein A3F00_00705 [Candidatus Daviesbacteria bacterium RIFCSPHIGHO2_12_FULL_37_11]
MVLFLLFLALFSALIFPRPKGEVKSLISPEFFKAINLTSTFSFASKSEGLSNIVGKNLEGKQGEYAVYIEDLNDGENYSLRSSDSFPAASLYKLYLMAAVLKEIENKQSLKSGDFGELKMENKVVRKKSDLVEEFGSVDFGYEDIDDGEIIEYTIEEALTRVGRISDNFASLMLARKIGWDNIQEVADELGSKNTVIKSPITTTAEDIGDFFKKLYKKEVVSPFVSEKVIEFLSLNQLNNRIPAGLSDGVKVVHKTGELAGVRHDAGIVCFQTVTSGVDEETPEVRCTPGVNDTPGVNAHAYVIVLMSKDLKYEDEGVETLAKISKDVYEYFKEK